MGRMRWLEMKRWLYRLPRILCCITGASICACLVYWGILQYRAFLPQKAPITIGYTAGEDAWTKRAIKEGIEQAAFGGWCDFVPVSYEEGITQLEKGQLTGLAVLPEGLVESILTGENKSVTLYMGDALSEYGDLFETLGNAVTSMLQLAQLQVYTLADLPQYGMEPEQCESLMLQVDAHNLALVRDRGLFFKHNQVSRYQKDTKQVYYGCIFCTILFLLFPVFVYSYGKIPFGCGLFYEKRLGISLIRQVLWRLLGITAYLFLVMEVIGLYYGSFSVGAAFVLTFSVASFALLIQAITKEKKDAWMVTIVSLGIQGYLSGCFVPQALLTVRAGEFAKWMPAYGWKKGLHQMIIQKPVEWLPMCVEAILFLICSILLIECREKSVGVTFTNLKKKKKMHLYLKIPGILIQFKRMVIRPAFWCIVLVAFGVSFFVARLEVSSNHELFVGIVDQTGDWHFPEEQGVIRYESFSSVEEMQKEILAGKIVCGYELKESLLDELLHGDGVWAIPSYGLDEILVEKAVEEVVFSQVFFRVSQAYYEENLAIAGLPVTVDSAHETFGLQVERLPNMQQPTEHQKITKQLLVRLMKGMLVVSALLYGILFTIKDHKYHRFYQRKNGVEWIMMVFFPVVLMLFLEFLLTE